MILFFDIDETLLDQRRAEAEAAACFLEVYKHRLDCPYSVGEFCQLWRYLREKHAATFLQGRISCQEQRRRRIRELFASSGSYISDAEADARFALYQEHYCNSWTLFEDVLPCLQSLPDYSFGIISNGSAEQQRRKLRQTGIEGFFSVTVISEEVGAAKPDPVIFLSACRQAGCSASNAIYIGDRLDVDVRASRSAGMKAFLLDRRQRIEPVDVEVVGSLTELCVKLRGYQ